jgi:hypothetical protein
MDEEKDDQPPFRWNPQAVFMLFFFMLAMAVPLMGVAWFARGYLSAAQPHAAAAPAVKSIDTSSLEKGLEQVSNAQFASAVTVEARDGVELSVLPEDMPARIDRIIEMAKDAGGSGLEMPSSRTDGARRLTIQVPASRYELLKRAIRGERVDFSAIPAGASTQLLEVNLRKP